LDESIDDTFVSLGAGHGDVPTTVQAMKAGAVLTSLVERAEERADRFFEYRAGRFFDYEDRRISDAERAHEAVSR
jgi:hypothetical protein